MDLNLARRLVWDALRTVLSRKDLIEDEYLTLYETGLSSAHRREHFKTLLVKNVLEAGYEIDPDLIPNGPGDTPETIILVLPGESTKGNKP